MPFKTTLLTGYYENYQTLADIVNPNMESYCQKQGYKFYCECLSANIPYGFWKLEFIHWAFEYGDVDLVLCTDLDVLITNSDIKIESFVDDDHDFYLTKDVNGINTGSFIIRNSEWSRKWLCFILDHQSEFDNEQTAIDYFRNQDEWKEKIKILPHPSINSYPCDLYAPSWGIIGDKKIDKPVHVEGNWEQGDFILHLPGKTLQDRIEIFETTLKLLS